MKAFVTGVTGFFGTQVAHKLFGAGHIYHGTAEGAVKTKSIATAVGKALNVPVKSMPKDKAMERFGFLGLL